MEIETTTRGVEPVGALLLELTLGGYCVRDAADFEEFLAGKAGSWDYIDDTLMALREAPTVLTAYLPQNEQGAKHMEALKSGLDRLREMDEAGEWGPLSVGLSGLREEDWANAWKQWYKPVRVSRRLTVCPSWEDYTPEPGETVLRLDPGMAFGTGTHETTRLCLSMLDRFDPAGKSVLDVGCGSGILSIGAMLLSAREALGIDIDQNAVRVAQENAERNGVLVTYRQGDLATGVDGVYDIIFANIVADAIRALAPDVPGRLAEDGVFIASGIIDTREAETFVAISEAGLCIVGRAEERGWVCVAAKRIPSREG